jgi:hypothetical protein
MSMPLLILLPPGFLAIMCALCFVGCNFQPGGLPGAGFFQYQDSIRNIVGNVALWPLNEVTGTTAFNLAASPPPGTDGTYLATAVPYPDDSGDALASAPSPGTFPALGQTPGIVGGDCLNGDPNQQSPCTIFDGGYVNVPANAAINPAQFTIEAWVRPDWTAADPAAYRVVLMSRNKDGGAARGFTLNARPDNSWAVSVGDGTSPAEVEEVVGSKLILGMSNYLAATYDGSTLTLFVDGFPSSKPNITYAPNTTKPLYIGTGAPELPLRTSPVVNDPTHGPLNPFKGVIQDVAIYNRALTAHEIAINIAHGNQCATS